MSHFNFDQHLAKSFRLMCLNVGSTVSLKALQSFENGDLRSLVAMTIDPSSYQHAHDYLADAQVVGFFKKLRLALPGIDRAEKSREIFFNCERACASVNARFSRYRCNGAIALGEALMLHHLDVAKDWIKSTLGPLPRDLNPRFGPGATFLDKGKFSTIPDKMSSRPTVTSEARCLLLLFRGNAWDRALTSQYWNSDPEVVSGNRFTTVPKTAILDRGICIEPSINVFYQLGVGSSIRSRLLRRGIDLDFGQDKHRQWARLASSSNGKATIDLSNASDTVARSLVHYLLPPEWVDLLETLRSPKTRVNGKWYRLEKFSSMGNGFTFELETLIFAALAKAVGCADGDFLVYGDDIILPGDRYDDMLAALAFCGFTPNPTKSFSEGNFRESCGGDFFSGMAVRPYFLKELPSHPSQWFSVLNGLRRTINQYRSCLPSESETPFCKARRVLMNALPRNLRQLTGPEYFGDQCITSDNYTFAKEKDCIRYVRVLRPRFKTLGWKYWHPSVVLASALYGAGDSHGVIPRGDPDSYRTVLAPYS